MEEFIPTQGKKEKVRLGIIKWWMGVDILFQWPTILWGLFRPLHSNNFLSHWNMMLMYLLIKHFSIFSFEYYWSEQCKLCHQYYVKVYVFYFWKMNIKPKRVLDKGEIFTWIDFNLWGKQKKKKGKIKHVFYIWWMV